VFDFYADKCEIWPLICKFYKHKNKFMLESIGLYLNQPHFYSVVY
jgi:hypothetical protein